MGKAEFMKAAKRSLFVSISIVSLASCRLVIITDQMGQVVSGSGQLSCRQESCTFPIDERTTDVFTAVPAEGFRFVRWEGICATSPVETCEVTLAPLPDNLIEYDGDIGLKPIFEPIYTSRTWFRDQDGDHYGSPKRRKTGISRPEGFVMNDSDCDDTNITIRPHIKEIEDKIDNNCNGKIDEGFVPVRWFYDADSDGFGNPNQSLSVMAKPRNKPTGYVRNSEDCNDLNANDNPKAMERASDSVDNDCDGRIDEPVNACTLTVEDKAMLAAVNQFRTQPRTCGERSYPAAEPLTWSCGLKTAALAHSKDMADNNYFSHTSLDGRLPGERIRQAGYQWSSFAENIAAGNSSVSSVMAQWIASSGHCENLMKKSNTELGAAKYRNSYSDRVVYWTQVFAKPR